MKQIMWLKFPLFIKFYITSRCNLRCSHCYLTDYTQEPTFDKIKELIIYLGSKKITGIGLLGGEPLIRSDLEDIIRIACQNNITTKIATNGTLICQARAKSLIESGCRHYQISLEGHNPKLNDSIRGQGTFEKVLNGILELKKSGAWISIAVTVSRQNFESIGEIHRLAREYRVNQLKLAVFAPVGTGKCYKENMALNREAISKIQQELIFLQNKYPKMEIDSYLLPTICESDSSCTFGCGAGTTEMVINSDLSVSACDILLEEDKTEIAVNDAKDIDKIWNNHPLFHKWRGLAPNDKTISIPSFDGVQQESCHVLNSIYGKF